VIRAFFSRLVARLNRAERPADFTQPVFHQLRGLPPESRPRARLLYGSTVGWLAGLAGGGAWRTVVNERIVEIPFVLRHLTVPPGASVLEFGHVKSWLALALASLGYRVTGVDLRPYPYRHPILTSIVGDFLARPLPEASFDAVVAVSAIEHCGFTSYGGPALAGADREVVDRMRQLLKPGGPLIMTVPFGRAGESPKGWRTYDAASLAALLAGFRVVEAAYYRGLDRESWEPVAPEALADVESAGLGYVQGVACVCAQWPA
jgi:SAM-dependent methyltransferase